MKKITFVCLAVAALVSSDKSTGAAPVNFELTLTTNSSADMVLYILSGAITASIPMDLSGTISATFDDAIGQDEVNDSTGISLSGADINLSDVTYDIDGFLIGGILVGFAGAEINTLDTNGYLPLSTTSPVNPFEYTFDPGGGSPTEIAVDAGVFTYLGTGPANGLIGSGTADFSTNPIAAEMDPVGQIGMVTQQAVLSEGHVFVTVSAPITFVDVVQTDPFEIYFGLEGFVVATGMYPIPEPSTVVLLGIAIVGLIPLWRRLRG